MHTQHCQRGGPQVCVSVCLRGGEGCTQTSYVLKAHLHFSVPVIAKEMVAHANLPNACNPQMRVPLPLGLMPGPLRLC
eukprot:scaffold225460_cov17-Tisochrysis_lutea.AAC.2